MSEILAAVAIFVESPMMDTVISELVKIENVEELYEVTGEYDIIIFVTADDIEHFRDILQNKIMKIRGIRSNISSIILNSQKGPRCAKQLSAPQRLKKL